LPSEVGPESVVAFLLIKASSRDSPVDGSMLPFATLFVNHDPFFEGDSGMSYLDPPLSNVKADCLQNRLDIPFILIHAIYRHVVPDEYNSYIEAVVFYSALVKIF